MDDSECSTDNYKSSNIGVATKNQKMLEFVSDHLKTKTKCVSMQLKTVFCNMICCWSI